MIRACFLEEINPKLGLEMEVKLIQAKRKRKGSLIKGSIRRRKNKVAHEVTLIFLETSLVHSCLVYLPIPGSARQAILEKYVLNDYGNR